MAIGVHESKSPHGSSWVAVHVIPESLPDDNISVWKKVPFQLCELDCDLQTVYKT